MTDRLIADIHARVLAGGRIADDEFPALERTAGLYDLAFLADAIRRRLHPERMVTYVIDRNINYTDICISACKFCAFFKAPEDKGGYLLSFDELGRKIEETRALGGTQVLLQGGCIPISRWSTTRRCCASSRHAASMSTASRRRRSGISRSCRGCRCGRWCSG